MPSPKSASPSCRNSRREPHTQYIPPRRKLPRTQTTVWRRIQAGEPLVQHDGAAVQNAPPCAQQRTPSVWSARRAPHTKNSAVATAKTQPQRYIADKPLCTRRDATAKRQPPRRPPHRGHAKRASTHVEPRPLSSHGALRVKKCPCSQRLSPPAARSTGPWGRWTTRCWIPIQSASRRRRRSPPPWPPSSSSSGASRRGLCRECRG